MTIMKYSHQLLLTTILLAFCGISFAHQTNNDAVYRIWLAGKSWAVDFSSADFQEFDETLENKTYRLTATPRDGKLHKHLLSVSIQIEQASNTGDASAFRDVINKRLSKTSSAIQSIKMFEHNSIPILRYSANWLASLGASQSVGLPGGPYAKLPDSSTTKTLEAFFAKNDTWMSVRLLFSDIDRNDEDYFFSLVDSIRFAEATNPISSFDFYHEGHSFFAKLAPNERFRKSVSEMQKQWKQK